MRALLVAVIVLASSASAFAYPQFQISKDQTCTGCHLKPSGGGLLNENGMSVAENISLLPSGPEFMYGAIPLPDWLNIGGDVRSILGYVQAPQRYLLWLLMQADVQAAATFSHFTIYATVGARPPEKFNETRTYVSSQEHFLQWQQEEGGHEGLFVRAGRFMPVFGLRMVEHTLYTRRYGGTPLFSETYGASVSFVKQRFEVHASAFLKDPLVDPVRLGNGGAVYGELRIDDKTQVGAGAMVEISSFDQKLRGTLTAKRYFAGPDILLQGELQLVNPKIDGYGYRQIVGHVMGTYFAPGGVMVDLGFGHYDENIRITNLDRDAFDLNVHWFAISHFEMLVVSRLEILGWGSGGPTGITAMLQGHYRL